jgi:homoserine kinase type II
MESAAHGTTDTVAGALAPYDLAPPVRVLPLADAGGINNRVRVVRTGAGTFIWKTYLAGRAPATIRYEHRLLAWLTEQPLSFATPAAIPTRAGDTLCRTPDDRHWQALFPLLPGEPLDRNDPAIIEAFGAALGELHATLARYPQDPVPDISSYAALHEIHPAVPDPYALTPGDFGLEPGSAGDAMVARWRRLLDEAYAFIAGPYRNLPRQMIHGDAGPGNAFAADGRITALFDFEFAMPDARAIDVASGLTFIMRLWERSDGDALAMAHRFCRGYRWHGELTQPELRAIPALMLLREVVGTIWWAGRNRANTPQRPTARLEQMEQLIAWLRRNEAAFFAAIG